MPKNKLRHRRIIKIPHNYLDAIDIGNIIFPSLFQFENGLKLLINQHLTLCYGDNWWEVSLKSRDLSIYNYAESIVNKLNSMPYIGAYSSIQVFKIHLITLGQLEEIVRKYKSDCIPELFPTIEFFLGHMEAIKRVRNLYSHMFPCITLRANKLIKREILTLAEHINSKLVS
jgi:hypothetical protein